MEEKKKRWRPSLTAYRALEKEIVELRGIISRRYGVSADIIIENEMLKKKLEDHIEGTSGIIADCDGWREKYRELMKRKDVLAARNEALENDLTHMGDELESLRDEKRSLNDEYNILQREYQYVINRGFWARLFNR